MANCAECHGDNGQGGIGPRLNDQGKLYNVLTPAGDPGTGHLNPNYLDNVLTVGGRYICGDPDSLMAPWLEPNGPLNYRQVEELIVWLNASQDVIFEPPHESHGEGDEEAAGPESVVRLARPQLRAGSRGHARAGLLEGARRAAAGHRWRHGYDDRPRGGYGNHRADHRCGTPDAPRQINLQANAALQFTDETGTPVAQIQALPGETIEFVIDNTAGFDHNFYIGDADALQVPFGETENGIATWASGVQTYTWTVPESGTEGLQFACTVPGHYQPMHGDIVITSGAPAGDGGEAAPAEEAPAEEARRRGRRSGSGRCAPATRPPAARLTTPASSTSVPTPRCSSSMRAARSSTASA